MAPDPLAALEALKLPDPPAPRAAAQGDPGPERFAWRLFRQGRGFGVDVLESQAGPRGWRAGDRVAPKDLPEPGTAAWAALGRREQEALTALRAWRRKPEAPPLALAAALEGHGRVLWAEGPGDPGGPAALVRELSVLEVRVEGEGWRLRLTVRPDGDGVLRPAGDRLRFTGFGPVHRLLDGIVGDGARVPGTQGPRLAAVLGRLFPHLPLLTDLEPAPAPPAETPEARVGLWLRGGPLRLEVGLEVRPGPGLPPQAPGEGARFVVAGPPGVRRLRRRDLILESGRAGQVQALLPAGARSLGPLRWRLDGLETVGAFLAGVRDLGGRVQADGVPGLVPALPRTPEAGDLRVELRSAGVGMELRGSFRGRPLEAFLPTLRGAGRFVDLDGSLLDLSGLLGGRLRGLAAWSREGKGAVRLPRAALALLEGVGLPGIPPLPAAPEQVPAGFRGELRPYQLEGFRWMARLLGAGLGACLADDMGLGKTVQTAALLVHRSAQGPALVVSPTSVAPNWRAELARFAPSLAVRDLEAPGPGDVVLASYGQLLAREEAFLAVDWGTVVLDEAHAIKNPETRRARASALLRARGRLALTGTPVENHPEELRSLLAWLLPDAAARLSEAQDPAGLRAAAAPFLLRRLKAEVLTDLPPKTELTVWVEPGEQEAAFHRDLLARCRSEGAAEAGTLHLLAALMRLRRACSHPSLADPSYAGPGAKLDLLLDRLATLREEGHRALVFSQFTDMLDLVQGRLEAAGIPFRRLDGSTPAAARAREAAAFQGGEGEVFLVSLRAGGTGLNLTAADDVFHLDPWWNPAVEDQASDRAHRLGRTRPVTVHRLVVRDSVEARVLALHGRKRAMVAELLEGRNLPAALDRATLEALLG